MNYKKKIVVFIDWYLPGYKAGGPIRSCENLISRLKDEFEFFVVTRNTDYGENIPYEGIKSGEWTVSGNGTNIFYFSEENISKANFSGIFSDINPDMVYINGIYSYRFSILPLILSKQLKINKIIVAPRGMLALSAIGVKKLKKNLFLKAARITGLYNNVIFHATSEHEMTDIQSQLGRKKEVRMAPNLPKEINPGNLRKRVKGKGKSKIISLARIAPEKNTKYALQILKGVKGDVEFDLFGAVYNQKYWGECLDLIRRMPPNIKVNYRGSVSNAGLESLLPDYHFMFMPTLGENFGHSVIESMGGGCPVIISDKTPWKNLEEIKTGWAIPLDNTDRFVRAVEHGVNMGQDEYDEWSGNAFRYAAKTTGDPLVADLSRKLFR